MRPFPGLEIRAVQFGVWVADQAGLEVGQQRLGAPGGYTGVATDPNAYDPDAVAIFLKVESAP